MSATTNENNSELVEHIAHEGKYYATVIRTNYLPTETTFISPDDYYQQFGFVVYPKGGVIKRHEHLPIERSLTGTPETLIVKKGLVKVDLYDDAHELLCSVKLGEGDIVLLVAGGHGIYCEEDTVLMEIKQGPYTGLKEKEFF